MGLLNQSERQNLIDLLCKLPGIDVYPHVRHSLTASLPDDLRNNIAYVSALNTDIASIVDMVSDDAWSKLPDDSYPILVIIENAINRVRGSRLEIDLYTQMNILRIRFRLPPKEFQSLEPPPPPLDHFMQKLYDLINQMPTLYLELNKTSDTFGHYVLKPKCKSANNRLIEACAPIREFTSVLEQSDDLKVKAHRSWLMNALLGFNNQAKIVEESISRFCDMYGTLTVLNQPAEMRKNIQQQLGSLIRCYEPVLKTAESLYSELCMQ